MISRDQTVIATAAPSADGLFSLCDVCTCHPTFSMPADDAEDWWSGRGARVNDTGEVTS